MRDSIKGLMPTRYTNLRKSGIVDAYPDLLIDKLKYKIEQVEWCEIRILDIWMENFNRIQDALIKAVTERGCTVKIILWHPQEVNALEKRSKALNKIAPETMIRNIIFNLEWIVDIFNKLEEIDKNHKDYPNQKIKFLENFEVKLSTGFISVQLIAYGSEVLVGNYLRNRVSSMGTQLKVSGEHKFLYREYNNHFFGEWNDTSNVVFTRELYYELLKWINNNK